jgi:hypothetical protein
MRNSKMMQGREEGEFTTFEDIFALALANTRHRRFTADSDKWHKVLYKVECTPMIGQIGLGESGGVSRCSPD